LQPFEASLEEAGRQVSRRKSSKRLARKFSVASELTLAYAADNPDLLVENPQAVLSKNASFGQSDRMVSFSTDSKDKLTQASDAAAALELNASSDSEDDHEEGLLAMSVCRHLLREDMEEATVQAIFEEHRVSYSQFALDPIGMLFHNPNLLFRVQDRLVEWKVAAPTIVALAAFGAPLDIDRVERAMQQRTKEQQAQRDSELITPGAEAKTGFTLSSWFGFGRSAAAPPSSVSAGAELEALMPSEPLLSEAVVDVASTAPLAELGWRRRTSTGSLRGLERGNLSSSANLLRSSSDLSEPFIAPEELLDRTEGIDTQSGPSLASVHGVNLGVEKRESAPILYQQAAALRTEELIGSALEQAKANLYTIRSTGVLIAPSLDAKHVDDAPKFLRKSFEPTSEQLRTLKLKRGANIITFTVLSNGQHVSSRIFLWHANDAIVISDVDGTITRSDVLGHLLPRVGRDWSQAGIAQLYSEISRHGFKLMYLTSRPIGQAGSTRLYLQNVRQGERAEWTLPEGPVVMSPDRLVTSFTREVIRRRPDEFKVAALQQIRLLFPPDYNPFFAGFGNRVTDEISYQAVGVPVRRIFTVNPRAELDVRGVKYLACETYSSLREALPDFFPDIAEVLGRHRVDRVAGRPQFTDVAYWDAPIAALELSDDALIERYLREALQAAPPVA